MKRECIYCDKWFRTKNKLNKHELICDKNPQNKPLIIRAKETISKNLLFASFSIIAIYLFTYFVANSYAESNGQEIRDLLKPQEWFLNKPKETNIESTSLNKISPTQSLTPTIDPDPIIDCKFTYIGTKKLKRSVCNNATDCEIEKGKYYLYYSVKKCKEDQQKYYAGTLEGHPYVSNQANTVQYPACIVYYPGLKETQTYYHLSPEKCIEEKNKVNSSPSNTNSTITCVVNYPCTGKSYTYQTDKSTCDFMQSGAKSTCSTYDTMKNLQEISDYHPELPQISPIDGSIHILATPTPKVPFGFSNY